MREAMKIMGRGYLTVVRMVELGYLRGRRVERPERDEWRISREDAEAFAPRPLPAEWPGPDVTENNEHNPAPRVAPEVGTTHDQEQSGSER